MGRPKKPIDPAEVERLAKFGCSQAEIAAAFNVDKATISRRFAPLYRQARASCKIALRRAQFERATGGSDAMLVHLGKHLLGQHDRIKVGVDADLADAARILEEIYPDAATDDDGPSDAGEGGGAAGPAAG